MTITQPELTHKTAKPNAISLKAGAELEKEFARHCPQSVQLYQRALQVFPGGVTHDSRRLLGPALFFRQAQGARKTDVDGHSYIDYWVGHGALLLGHKRPEIIEAVNQAAQDMTHAGGCHEREVQWGELVQALIPSAERVRFTASGSEATGLAVRLARAMTGKNCILKFEGHFHGWMDHLVEAIDLPFDLPFSAGVPTAVREQSVVLPANKLELVEQTLSQRQDIAAIILEPTGAAGGAAPVSAEFLKGLRTLATRFKVALIFDEVITGFRIAPGGAQQRFGVRPDLTCLAKILAGGLPGGAVCGTREAFAAMEFSNDAARDRRTRVTQNGTFNSNPLSAAAGIQALNLIREGHPCEQAERSAEQLRGGLNALFQRAGIPWAAYGFGSIFHLLTSDAQAGQGLRDGTLQALEVDPHILKAKGEWDAPLRRALQLEGVDLPPGRQAWISATHGPREISETIAAFERVIRRLQQLGLNY